MQAWQDRADDEVARRSDKGVANAVEDRDAILHLIKSGYTFPERALTARDAARGPCSSLDFAWSRKRKISRAISEVSSTLGGEKRASTRTATPPPPQRSTVASGPLVLCNAPYGLCGGWKRHQRWAASPPTRWGRLHRPASSIVCEPARKRTVVDQTRRRTRSRFAPVILTWHGKADAVGCRRPNIRGRPATPRFLPNLAQLAHPRPGW